ncbi:MAG: hypothetical protein QOI55_2775, partial [Actinomycetota bacterium]|nr:hypothetical protein [Actinomycetota bacterium]
MPPASPDLLRGASRSVEHLHSRQCVLGEHRWRRASSQRVLDALVEREPPPWFALNRRTGISAHDPAPPVGRLGAKAGCIRTQTGPERILLSVQMLHDVRALTAENAKTRTRGRGDGAGPEMRLHTRRVVQRDENVVVGAATERADLAVDVQHRSEEGERLVDEVCTQVEQHATSLRGGRDIAPRTRVGSRSPPFEARLKTVDPAESSLVQELAQRQLVGIPAAVVERNEHATPCRRMVDERARVRRVDGHGLFNNNSQPSV